MKPIIHDQFHISNIEKLLDIFTNAHSPEQVREMLINIVISYSQQNIKKLSVFGACGELGETADHEIQILKDLIDALKDIEVLPVLET